MPRPLWSTGLFIGLIHAGIVALHGAQAGIMPISDLPYVKEALDAAMSTGRLTFSNARYATYLAGSALVLMAVTIVCYLVRRIVCRIVCSADAETSGNLRIKHGPTHAPEEFEDHRRQGLAASSGRQARA